MKIVQIVPGSGNTFYCQNCLRDIAMVRTLRALGHDVAMVPMYLPLFGEAADTQQSGTPVFYGAVSRHYADYMGRRLALDAQRIRIVPVGIATDGYTESPLPFDPPVIGYLSRLSQADGFGLLVEAFIRLKQDPAFAAARLIATGGQTGDDRAVLAAARRALAAHGWEQDLTVRAEFDKPARAAFLAQLTVLSAPALKGGAFGTFILEALAAGVPVVQPRLGAFTELVEDTGGGVLYSPNDAAALAAALKELLSNPSRVRQLGAQGRAIVRLDFSIQATAARLLDAYAAIAAVGQ